MLACCCPILYAAPAPAENDRTTALKKRIEKYSASDTNRARLLLDLGREYNMLMDTNAMSVLEEAEKILLVAKNPAVLCDVLGEQGRALLLKGEEDQSRRLFKRCLQVAEEYNILSGKAVAHKGLGVLYGNAAVFDNAISEMQQALEAYTQLQDVENMAKCNLNIGTFLASNGDLDQIITYYLKAEELYQKSGSAYGLGKAYHSLASAYFNKGKFKQAYNYIELSKLNYKKGDYAVEIYAQQGLEALCLVRLGKNVEAKSLALRTADDLAQASDPNLQCELLIACAEVMLHLKESEQGLAYAKECGKRAQKHGFLYYKARATKLEGLALADLNRFQESYVCMLKANTYQDTLYDEQLQTRIQSMVNHYESMAKDKKILNLESDVQKNETALAEQTFTLRVVLILLALVAASLGVSIWFYLKSKRDKERLELSQQELLERNAQLDALNLSKNKLFKIMAHDLRSPIGSLMHLPDIYQNFYEAKDLQGIDEMNQVVFKTMRQLHHLLDSLLTWATAESGQMQQKPERLKVAEQVKSVENLYAENLVVKNIALTTEVPAELECWADSNGMYTILRNLVNNAIKFSYPGSSIQLVAARDADWVRITLQDQGKGMPDHLLEKLFSVGEGKKSIGTQNEKGTGLGMLIVKELLQLNNAQMLVQSTYGTGTRITLWFPAREGASTTRPTTATGALPQA